MIRKFIYKCTYFAVVFILITIASDYVTSSIVKNNTLFRTNESVRHIALGHSHTALAYNDSIVRNFRNFGLASEYPYVTCAKAEDILEGNPFIENVFIEYSNNLLTARFNNKVEVLRKLNKQFAYLLSYPEKMKVIQHEEKSFYHYLEAIYSSKLIQAKYILLDKEEAFISLGVGGFAPRDGVHKEQDGPRPERVYTWSIDNLERVVKLCQSYGKNVVLIRSPMHSENVERENEYHFQEILKQRFSNVVFLDFSDYPATQRHFFDYGHLNRIGAKEYSVWFNELIKTKLDSILTSNQFHHRFGQKIPVEILPL